MFTAANYVALSFDSLFLCFFLGSREVKEGAGVRLLMAVALSDALGTLCAGSGIRGALAFALSSIVVGIGLGLLRRDRWLSFALPVILGVDNLLAPEARCSAFAAGASSFFMGALGLLAARGLGRASHASRPLQVRVKTAILALELRRVRRV